MDEEFEEDELLEESDISDRRTLQVLGVMEENDVLERLEKGYRKNGHETGQLEKDLEILRDYY